VQRGHVRPGSHGGDQGVDLLTKGRRRQPWRMQIARGCSLQTVAFDQVCDAASAVPMPVSAGALVTWRGLHRWRTCSRRTAHRRPAASAPRCPPPKAPAIMTTTTSRALRMSSTFCSARPQTWWKRRCVQRLSSPRCFHSTTTLQRSVRGQRRCSLPRGASLWTMCAPLRPPCISRLASSPSSHATRCQRRSRPPPRPRSVRACAACVSSAPPAGRAQVNGALQGLLAAAPSLRELDVTHSALVRYFCALPTSLTALSVRHDSRSAELVQCGCRLTTVTSLHLRARVKGLDATVASAVYVLSSCAASASRLPPTATAAAWACRPVQCQRFAHSPC
jgi:hypothetical protein